MESSEKQQLISAFVALFIQIIVWFLNQSGKKDEVYKIDSHSKRLELLQKIKGIDIKSANVQEEILAREVSEILKFLKLGLRSENEKFLALPKVTRVFLLFKPASASIFVLQFLFFICIYYITLSLFLLSDGILLWLETNKLNPFQELRFASGIVGLVIFVPLAIFFTYIANKIQLKILLKKNYY